MDFFKDFHLSTTEFFKFCVIFLAVLNRFLKIPLTPDQSCLATLITVFFKIRHSLITAFFKALVIFCRFFLIPEKLPRSKLDKALAILTTTVFIVRKDRKSVV